MGCHETEQQHERFKKSGPRVARRRHKPERRPQLWDQVLVNVKQPADHEQHVEQLAEENTRVST